MTHAGTGVGTFDPCAARGSGLVELLVAMTLALLLVGAAVSAFVKGRDTHAAMDSTARLQETARYALGVIESDLRMSGHLGLLDHPGLVGNLDAGLTGPTGGDEAFVGCRPRWTTDLDTPVEGWDQADGRHGLGPGCAPNGAWRASTDGLVLRRASADRIVQSAAGLRSHARQVLIVTSHSSGRVYVGDAAGTMPAGYAASGPAATTPPTDTRRLLVHAYYVSSDSSEGAGFPSLRRKRLVAGPAIQDEEIIPGIDDLQVQYGIDADGDGSADRWLNAGQFAPPASIVAARVWLRARARERDGAWSDTTRYSYANQDETVIPVERPFRRTVVVKTIHLRNGSAP